MTDLTAKQEEVLDVIRRFTRLAGYPPTVREIGEKVGLTSSSTVHAHLQALQRKGFLYRDPTKPRALVVRDLPAEPLTLADEIDVLTDKLGDLELDNEGLSKLLDAWKAVTAYTSAGWSLVKLDDGTDVWTNGADQRRAGSFDRDVSEEMYLIQEAAAGEFGR